MTQSKVTSKHIIEYISHKHHKTKQNTYTYEIVQTTKSHLKFWNLNYQINQITKTSTSQWYQITRNWCLNIWNTSVCA